MTIAPEGRKLLRIEARNAETPIERKPEWIKTRANMGPEYTRLRSLVKTESLVKNNKSEVKPLSFLEKAKLALKDYKLEVVYQF